MFSAGSLFDVPTAGKTAGFALSVGESDGALISAVGSDWQSDPGPLVCPTSVLIGWLTRPADDEGGGPSGCARGRGPLL